MNLLQAEAERLAQEVAEFTAANRLADVESVLCPVALHLSSLSSKTHPALSFGAQDCHYEESGAHTGDISASMIVDAGAKYVIVGHSERRQRHHESSQLVNKKASMALSVGLVPIICIGETLEQREAGLVESVLGEQIAQSLPAKATAANVAIAYEPIWAIGTGKVATPDIVAETHKMVAERLPTGINILYGGSVNADNAEDILGQPNVGGVLVGGASLKAESFCAIIAAAQRLAASANQSKQTA